MWKNGTDAFSTRNSWLRINASAPSCPPDHDHWRRGRRAGVYRRRRRPRVPDRPRRATRAIIVETEGESTVYSTTLAGEIMRRMGLNSAIVVSDGYHIYRVKRMLESRGLKAYGSPRKERNQGPLRDRRNCVKQAVGSLLWRVGVGERSFEADMVGYGQMPEISRFFGIVIRMYFDDHSPPHPYPLCRE